MKKIVIVGSPGAGKSTLASTLGFMLDISVIHLDYFFWLPGWKPKPLDMRRKILQDLVQENQWVIEGSYLGLNLSDPCLEVADTIIFLDIISFVCLQQIIIRHLAYRRRSRPDIPQGCMDKLTPLLAWRVMGFPFQRRKELMQKLDTYKYKHIICLRSRKAVKSFLAQQEQDRAHPCEDSAEYAAKFVSVTE